MERWYPGYVPIAPGLRLGCWLLFVVVSSAYGGGDGTTGNESFDVPDGLAVVYFPSGIVVLLDLLVALRRWYVTWLYGRNRF